MQPLTGYSFKNEIFLIYSKTLLNSKRWSSDDVQGEATKMAVAMRKTSSWQHVETPQFTFFENPIFKTPPAKTRISGHNEGSYSST
jgi:hypothetical protein